MTEQLSTNYSMLYLPNVLLDYITSLVAEAACCDCIMRELCSILLIAFPTVVIVPDPFYQVNFTASPTGVNSLSCSKST